MKENPLKRGGQHLNFIQEQIDTLGFYLVNEFDKDWNWVQTKKVKTVDDYVAWKVKERIKGI